jgi:2OG-Fe(II) oxygenase superfamily
VGEWFNPSVLKTEESKGSVSSNLTASAKFNMSFTEQIIQYKNVLPDEMLKEIPHILNQSKWGLNSSDPNYQNYQVHKQFWGMRLDDDPFCNKKMFGIVKKLTKKKFTINQILANAQSSLQDGSPHADAANPKGRTFIFYANGQWDYQWGGQTIFFDRYAAETYNENREITVNSDETYSVYPIPNSAVFFPSNMIHYGQGPSRDFYGIRYTIAFHLIEI